MWLIEFKSGKGSSRVGVSWKYVSEAYEFQIFKKWGGNLNAFLNEFEILSGF